MRLRLGEIKHRCITDVRAEHDLVPFIPRAGAKDVGQRHLQIRPRRALHLPRQIGTFTKTGFFQQQRIELRLD